MTKVLIVEDKEESLYYLQALLTGHGYAVDIARHGAEALVRARQAAPELVVSDLLMPVMDGYTLLRHWKADPNLRDIPFVVYTATYTEPEDEALALSLGAQAFILKPAEPEDFVARIRQVLATPRSERPAAERLSPGDDDALLKSYSQTLIRKLEEKTLQLESTNRALQRDIAERRRAEQKLRESEERFRELAETIQEVFWITDPAKKEMLYISPAYEKLWGRTCRSLYESPQTWMDAIHPDDLERVAASAATRQAAGDYDETYRILRPDGEVRWIRDQAFPVHDAEGGVIRIVGTAEDVTNRRQLEEQFLRSQKMEAIGQLAAGVAHDFNNLIATILGNAQLALDEVQEAGVVRDSLQEIRKASSRAAGLVQQILTFGRQQPQERRILQLSSTLGEARTFLRATIPTVVELDFHADPDVPPVLADPTQMYQVIANLCTNAWHALEDKPGMITVRLAPVVLDASWAARLGGLRPGDYVGLSVTDNGKGLDPSTMERIFDPFFTTKEPGRGTGLGLSVVHGIVQQHDGAIVVESEVGRGTSFQVYLPAAVAPTEDAPTVPAVPHRGQGQHILYVDDEEALVLLVSRLLKKLGYQVTGLTRTSEASEAFSADPDRFDLVLLDLNMPGVSGLDLGAAFLARKPDLPVLLCSGHVTDELRQKAKEIGFLDVLYKPNTLDEMAEAIHRAVGAVQRT